MAEHLVPTVVQSTARGERSFDLFSRLLQDRIVFLGSPVDDTVANLICAQLLFCESDDPDRDVHLYINSPGGSGTAMFAIYDTMRYVRPDVATYCMGMAASAAAVLLAAGAAGKRYALPNSRMLIHQPHAEIPHGQAVDLGIAAKEILRQRRRMEEVLAAHTGQTIETIARDTDRDFIMNAAEALEYGMVDDVLDAGSARLVPSASQDGASP